MSGKKLHRTLATLALLTFATAVLSANTCSAIVIGDFEGGSLDGWGPAPSGTPIVSAVNGVGNTLNQGSLAVDNAANDFWGPAKNILNTHTAADVIANRFLIVDVTFRGLAGDIAGYGQVTDMAVNDGTGYFQQRPPATGNPSWGGPGADVVRTLTWDLDLYLVAGQPYRQWLAANPTPSHITFWFVAQGGGNAAGGDGRIYFDNARLVVPEPGTMALAALVVPALGLARRRRK